MAHVMIVDDQPTARKILEEIVGSLDEKIVVHCFADEGDTSAGLIGKWHAAKCLGTDPFGSCSGLSRTATTQ